MDASCGLAVALASALVYSVCALFLKGALERGASSAQVSLVTNLATALVAQPLWLLDRPQVPNASLWAVLLCSTILFAGQVFTFAALARGDVSVVTPMLGTKIILVTAINALVFGVSISLRWWIAAAFGFIAIVFIAGSAPRGKLRSIALAALFSLAGALCYSLTDVLVQSWRGTFDTNVFPPAMFGILGIFTLIFYGFTDRRAFLLHRPAWLFLWIGGLLFGAQIVGVFFSLVWSGDATSVNILYASRCFWSVVAAWVIGRYFGLRDREAGSHVMLWRLIGAILLLASIVLILA